ncbi:HD domain-containing protein [Pseudodesulfovibrio senegalensis]|uniref:HD domain-containing protein n=1 Tax=Pseudodesulfovibrio senegalensis TaxID=1721087 RepID=A0A6N6MZW4_9BACT|nr:HD domain-containing protein [Pseudodesulfovibrio senegalensis]
MSIPHRFDILVCPHPSLSPCRFGKGETVSTTKTGVATEPQPESDGLHPVSPSMLLPERCGDFELYLAQNGSMVLYAVRGELFSEEHRERLADRGVDRLYVKSVEKEHFDNYVREHLDDILADESIPVQERANVWLDATSVLARKAFDRTFPKSLNNVRFSRIRKILRQSMSFFSRPEVLRHLAVFTGQGREQYHHGIGVMVLAAGVMNTLVRDDADHLVSVCSGAILHDVGKLTLPENLFDRHEDDLTPEELEQAHSHPVLGVSRCASVQLPQEALHCILFHHEREDGSGFPSQALGSVLPLHAKVVGLCDEYENLTREKPWRKAFTPFEALSHIKAEKDRFDPDLIKRLILVLSRAEIM